MQEFNNTIQRQQAVADAVFSFFNENLADNYQIRKDCREMLRVLYATKDTHHKLFNAIRLYWIQLNPLSEGLQYAELVFALELLNEEVERVIYGIEEQTIIQEQKARLAERKKMRAKLTLIQGGLANTVIG